jgi:hypothetical protein
LQAAGYTRILADVKFFMSRMRRFSLQSVANTIASPPAISHVGYIPDGLDLQEETKPRRNAGAPPQNKRWQAGEVFWFRRSHGIETEGHRKIIYFVVPTSR